MNRFASIATTAAFAGALIGAGTAAQATSELYMIPLSPLTATYNPGDTVRFAAVVDLNTSAFASLNVPFAAAFTGKEFNADIAGGNAPYVDGQPTQTDPNNTRTTVFNKNVQSYQTTASSIGGSVVYTIQNTVGQVADVKSGVTLAFAAGTYTVGTFSFPIAATNNTGSATIYLPTPFGYSNSSNATDGGFQVPTGPTLTLLGKAPSGASITEPITFPAINVTPGDGKYSSLTFKVKTTGGGGGGSTPAPSSLLVVAMGALPAIGLLRRRAAK